MNDQISQNSYRFGGHQTFPLRTAWLPKAAKGLCEGKDVLGDMLEGVVSLGLGKNMVEALRCWVDAYGVAHRQSDGWRLSKEGEAIFGDGGYDPYLEDGQTLWWLHWKIATQTTGRFYAWELLFNRWNEPSFTASAVLAAFEAEAERSARRLSPISLKQHFDVWLRTYCLTAGSGANEEGLDSPLASLGLIRPAGELEGAGRRETVYSFDLSPKRSISQALFQYCLMAWWEERAGTEETIPFHEVVNGPGSPGRIFRMPEAELRSRLDLLGRSKAEIRLVESVNQQQLQRTGPLPAKAKRLARVYEGRTAEVADA